MNHTIKTQFAIRNVTVNTHTWDDDKVNEVIQQGLNAILAPKIAAVHRAEQRLWATVNKLENSEI